MSLIKPLRRLKDNPETVTGPTGKLGFEPNESIRLDAVEDMAAVRALIHILQDEPDKARALVRDLSARDRAVLQFHLAELSRIVQEEDQFRVSADQEKARLVERARAYPDGYDI